MAKISTKVIILIILALFVVAGGFYYYRAQVNYLIPGVPYYGFYNHFFDADSTRVTSVADILDYWGDKVDLPALLSAFAATSTTLQLQKFFQEKGYETYRYASAQPGNEINEIKKFVNPKKKIPVIVYQRRSVDPARIINGFRVVIGVFDSEKKIIVHDHDFGNNYEISYKDFEVMFGPNARAILAVWPSDDLAKKIKGPDYSKEYPKRLRAMDNLGELLVKGADAVALADVSKNEQALQLYQEFVADPKFSYFPPAHQVDFYTFLAQIYLQLGKTDEAIKVINEKALPINHDLTQSYEDWEKPAGRDRFVWPYYVLGGIYQKKGDKELARKNFEEALKINPDYKPAQEALQQLK